MQARSYTTLALGAAPALLLGAAVAFAQSADMPEQQTEDPMVAADEANYVAHLAGANEVPEVDTEGMGAAWVHYDAEAGTLTWTVEYEGLTGPATGAHFHGPATAEENAGVVVNIAPEGDIESPIEGTAEITEDQAAQLADGQWYLNIHTEANGGGEIRGQVMAAPDDMAAEAEAAPAEPAEPAGPDPAVIADLMDDGETVYSRNCAGCHGAEGGGGEGPALAGFERLQFASAIIRQVLFGGAYMPPFEHLSNQEIAAVATYIRNSFGNDFGPVLAGQVAGARPE